MKNLIFLSLVVLIGLGSSFCSNMIESKYQLAESSRMPRWTDASNMKRSNFLIDVLFYAHPSKEVEIIYLDRTKNNQKTITLKGTRKYPPETEKRIAGNKISYPLPVIINVGEIEEILEQREANNILHIVN